MSDLITHLGVGYLAARALRVRDPRPILIGSVLPDISTALWKAPGFFGWYHPMMFPYLESFGTPFVLLFLGATIALLARKPRPAAAGIYGGCALHLLFDLLPRGAGGELLLYPVSLREFSLDLYWEDGSFARALMLACGGVLAWGLTRLPTEPFFARSFSWRRHATAFAIVAVACLIPCFTVERYYAENVCNMRFWDEPEKYEGRVVELAFDLNHGKDPKQIKGIRIDSKERLQPGQMIWLRGVYRDRTLHVLEVRNIQKQTKEYGSAAGLAAFAIAFAFPFGFPPGGNGSGQGAGRGTGSFVSTPRRRRTRAWASQLRKALDRAASGLGSAAPVLA